MKRGKAITNSKRKVAIENITKNIDQYKAKLVSAKAEDKEHLNKKLKAAETTLENTKKKWSEMNY